MDKADHIIGQLRNTLSKMELSLSALSDAIVWINKAGVIQWCNGTFNKLLDRSHIEILGNSIYEVLPLSKNNNLVSWEDILIKKPDQKNKAPFYEFKKKDKTILLDIDANQFYENSKEVVIVIVLHDVTEKQELLEKDKKNWLIQEANRLKNELLNNISHELRTPLNAIVGYSEIIRDEMENSISVQQKEYLKKIVVSANHLAGLINDLLLLSEKRYDKLEFQPADIDLTASVNEIMKYLNDPATAKEIQIKMTITETGKIHLDPRFFKQVIYNFLSNAIKFTPKQGHIEICIKPENEKEFRLEVKDSGIGISKDELEKLFVAFEQIESGPLKKYAGMGLGLALTKRIVEEQKGRVGVTSVPGKGSTFYAILPRQA